MMAMKVTGVATEEFRQTDIFFTYRCKYIFFHEFMKWRAAATPLVAFIV